MGGSSSKTTVTNKTTKEEIEYQKQQIELAKQQLELVKEQHGWNSEIFALTKPLLQKYADIVDQQLAEYNDPQAAELRQKQRDLELQQLDFTSSTMPMQKELLQLQLDEIKRGGKATDEQKALIGEITNRALDAGKSDISAFLNQGLAKVRNELSVSRGMRPDDSPIVDAGEDVLKESVRQQGLLESNLRGAQANAELNFPLNASQLTSAQGQWQQQFTNSMTNFMSALKDNATQNRFQFGNSLFQAPMTAAGNGIGLINAARPSGVSFARDQTQTTTQGGGFGSILGGVGGFLSGVGSLFSSEEWKTNVQPVGGTATKGGGAGQFLLPGQLVKRYQKLHPDGKLGPPGTPVFNGGRAPTLVRREPQSSEDALARIASVPVNTWEYTPESGLADGQRHIGPMAEDFNTMVMGKEPKKTIDAVDAIGSLTAAVQALEKRTRPPPGHPVAILGQRLGFGRKDKRYQDPAWLARQRWAG